MNKDDPVFKYLAELMKEAVELNISKVESVLNYKSKHIMLNSTHGAYIKMMMLKLLSEKLLNDLTEELAEEKDDLALNKELRNDLEEHMRDFLNARVKNMFLTIKRTKL